jgi:hypothetical protein
VVTRKDVLGASVDELDCSLLDGNFWSETAMLIDVLESDVKKHSESSGATQSCCNSLNNCPFVQNFVVAIREESHS